MVNGESMGGLPPRPDSLTDRAVAVWREPLTLGTYRPEPPDRYPAYLDRRVYQGSSGRVYPLPFHDRIEPVRVPVQWDAVHLENRWLRLTVLPEIGGRIYAAQDRTRGYDFFYRNPVIKPALVGLAGPWIAGGVEFNWPQHHRPATFLPTDVQIEHEPDGAVTVWCSDHEPFARMKGMHGVRLSPDRATVEVRVRLYNRSERPQTFLWWANVAARVHDDYQSFFPRDVQVVADHAKRAVSAFPAADRPYYGIDYPARHDVVGTAADGTRVRGDRLDWYRNIPVPTSYMCLGSHEGFFGGYDHRERAGFVHVADPWYAVGKKQWTWGNADFGHAWDRNLADDGASYVELMAGAFTDNQPDFSFIAPGETKAFSQTWYPIHDIGTVHAATAEAATRVDVECRDGRWRAHVGVVVTAERAGLVITLADSSGAEIDRCSADGAPGSPAVVDLPLTEAQAKAALHVRVTHDRVELVSWSSVVSGAAANELARPATEPPPPAEVDSVERLALIGAHLEQYRHATRSPLPYWREALRRDPGHVASSVGLAFHAYRGGDFAEAERLLRGAVDRLTGLNPNPADTGALYALGLVLERQGRAAEAYDAYAKSSWSRAWRAAAGYRMARLDTAGGRHAMALQRLDDVLRTEPEHLQARALRVLVLRRTGDAPGAQELAEATLSLDPLDWWTRYLVGLPLTTDAQTCLDVAIELAGVGEAESALRVLDVAVQREAARPVGQTAAGPLLEYHRAHLLRRMGRHDAARRAAVAAQRVEATWCFPSRLDDALVLEEAVAADDRDARARALLGHWLYAQGRHDEAMAAWQDSVERDPDDPVVWRNLALAAHDDGGDARAARAAYDRALAVSPQDARLVYESDQLDIRLRVSPRRRLERLDRRRALVETRDDATVQLVHLLLSDGRLDEARDLMLGRTFQPWEGGEGQVLGAWDRLCRLQARRKLSGDRSGGSPAGKEAEQAVRSVQSALHPPASLGEARHPLANTAELHLLQGDALAVAGDIDAARVAWEQAAEQQGHFLAMAVHAYSEATASSVLALRRLGREADARHLTDGLRAYCESLAVTPPVVDYFATSLPSLLLFAEDATRERDRRLAFLHVQLDLLDGQEAEAVEGLATLLKEDPNHTDALDLLALLRHHRSGAHVIEETA